MIPLDPRPIPQRAGLGPAECVTCGAPCLAAVGNEQPHCDPCRRARVELATAAPLLLRFKSSHQCRRCARWLEGEWSQAPADSPERESLQRQMDAGCCDACQLASAADSVALLATRTAILGLSHHAAIERHVRHEEPAAVPVKIKILEPAIELPMLNVDSGTDYDRMPNAARRLAKTATEYGRRVRCTYALARDMIKGKDIHSLCIRLWTEGGQRFGYASYVDGRFSSAVLWRAEEGGPRLARGIDEFAHLALGQVWTPPTPPPVGPCPRCQRPVRWITTGDRAGQPYGHNIPESKTRCPGML